MPDIIQLGVVNGLSHVFDRSLWQVWEYYTRVLNAWWSRCRLICGQNSNFSSSNLFLVNHHGLKIKCFMLLKQNKSELY